MEKNIYYVIGVERGRITSEKIFYKEDDILYYLLEPYVYGIAGKNVWEKAGGNFELYANLLPKEQIRVFNIINPKYGERRASEISEL